MIVILMVLAYPTYAQNINSLYLKKIKQMESSITLTEETLSQMSATQEKSNALLKKTLKELEVTKAELEKTKHQVNGTKFNANRLSNIPFSQDINRQTTHKQHNRQKTASTDLKATTVMVPKTNGKITPQRGYVLAGQNGFGIVSKYKKSKLFFNGVFQFDQDIFTDAKGLTINNGVSSDPILNRETVDRFWIRRARPILSGTFLDKTDFYFAPDFGEGQIRLFDAFIDLRYLRTLSLRVGKQNSLLASLENLNDNSGRYTIEFGYTDILAPNREYGLALHGEWGPEKNDYRECHISRRHGFEDWFAYEIGVFSGTFDNTNPGLNPVSLTEFSSESSTIADKDIEARFFSNPLMYSPYPFMQHLGVGFAGGTGSVSNQGRIPDLVSIGQNPIFVYQTNVLGNGLRSRLHPQGFWIYGPFGITYEWAHTKQQLSSGIISDNTHPPTITQVNHASETEVIYNLTQEPLQFDGIIPNKNFSLLEKGAYGAFQLVVRFTNLNLGKNIFNDFVTIDNHTIYTFSDPRVSVQQANTWTFGLNWYWNKNLRITTEFDYSTFKGGCSTGGLNAPTNPGCLTALDYATASTSTVLNRPNEIIYMQRIQVAF